jgi:processive 1,2-diacylglycerol beta-glucosyltransferase
VVCHDVLAQVPAVVARAYPATYYLLVRHLAWLWGTCFELLDSAFVYRFVQPLRRLWNVAIGRGYLRWLNAQAFDVVVATHFLPADLFAAGRRAGWLVSPSVVVITDLHPHRLWLAPETNAFVVATEQAAATCEQRGIARGRVHALGIPIAGTFRAPVNRSDVLSRLGFSVERRTVLVTSGSRTVGAFEQVVEALWRLEEAWSRRLQLLVVCGESAAAARRLERLASRVAIPTRIFGFVDNMPELMGASDLVVAKAGGLTVTEVLAEGLPLIVYHVIPGQERWNARYVEQHGAAIIANTPQGVADAVRSYLDDPRSFDRLRAAAQTVSRPAAADAIVTRVIAPLVGAP